jgi:hypothetical protein
MLIAFEGPDKTGKSTSATALDWHHQPQYNMTDTNYRAKQREVQDETLVGTFDRIDWLTHTVYRLAMPEHEWNDARIRTVFSAPDVHLVIKVHEWKAAQGIDDELYEGKGRIVPVNQAYRNWASFLLAMNRAQDYNLFKSISVMEVSNFEQHGEFSQKLVAHDSPGRTVSTRDLMERLVTSDSDLLDWLREAHHES